MLQWAKAGIGIATIGLAITLVPALSASASMDKSAKGSDPSSPVCHAYRSALGSDTKGSAPAAKAAKALASGHWAAAKRDFSTAFSDEANEFHGLVSALSGAPNKVKRAASELLTSGDKVKSILEKSNSAAQFSTAVSSLFKSPKAAAAGRTLTKYATGLCGSSITS
jgi:hypothetical protein